MPAGRDDFAIRHVASLARLSLTPDEEALYSRQVARVLDYARRILESGPPDAPPAQDSAAPAPGPVREDSVLPSLDRGEATDAAPDRRDPEGLVRVPRVIG